MAGLWREPGRPLYQMRQQSRPQNWPLERPQQTRWQQRRAQPARQAFALHSFWQRETSKHSLCEWAQWKARSPKNGVQMGLP